MTEPDKDKVVDPDTGEIIEPVDIKNPEAALKVANETIDTREKESKKSVTIRDTKASALLDPNMYVQMKALANDFIASKAVPNCWQTASQVLVGLQTGLEMGMKPMEAMNSLYPVNGAINVWGKATTRRVREHGYSIKYFNESQEAVSCTIQKGKEKYTETFEFADAEASGYVYQKNKYTGKQELKIGWKPGMNRKKKLRYGVLSLIISTYIPEVLGSAMGVVEVSDDFDLGTNENPKLIDSGDKRKRMIEAQNNFKKSKTKAKAIEPEDQNNG